MKTVKFKEGSMALWEELPKAQYQLECVGGGHKLKGCGNKFIGFGQTQCPKCGNMYVEKIK